MAQFASRFPADLHCAQLLSSRAAKRLVGFNSPTPRQAHSSKSEIKRRTDPSPNRLSKRENDRCRRAKRLWHGKKTKGVKRQIVTDDHKANLHDTKIGYWVAGLAIFTYPTLKKICGDGGYRGSFVYEEYKYFGLQVEISKKLKPHGRQVLPKRWIVERTFDWLNHSRRLSKDYELTVASAETLIKISHILRKARLWLFPSRLIRLYRHSDGILHSSAQLFCTSRPSRQRWPE